MGARSRPLRRTALGVAALSVVVLVFAVARLKPPTVRPHAPREAPRLLAQATASTGWAYFWDITVSANGSLRIQRDPVGRFVEGRALTTEELQDFIARLEKEQPWELASDVGALMVDGPERRLEFDVAGRHARVTLWHTPEGLTQRSLETSRLDLPRAIRLCEAIRALAHDESLRSCIDGPLSTQRRSD